MKFFCANLEMSAYTITGYGKTEEEAEQVMRKAFAAHFEEFGGRFRYSDAETPEQYLEENGWDIYEFEIGKSYRDNQPYA